MADNCSSRRRKPNCYNDAKGNRYYRVKVSKSHAEAVTTLRKLWQRDKTFVGRDISSFFETMIYTLYMQALKAGKIDQAENVFRHVKCISDVDANMKQLLALITENKGNISVPMLEKISEVSKTMTEIVGNQIEEGARQEADFNSILES